MKQVGAQLLRPSISLIHKHLAKHIEKVRHFIEIHYAGD